MSAINGQDTYMYQHMEPHSHGTRSRDHIGLPQTGSLVAPERLAVSVAVLAETPLRSPRKLLFSLSKNIFSGSKHPEKYFILL